MKTRLEIGDIIVVSNALMGESEYPVKRIEGNKAFTDFRIFNAKVYNGTTVYEYGKRTNQWSNSYWVKKGQEVSDG